MRKFFAAMMVFLTLGALNVYVVSARSELIPSEGITFAPGNAELRIDVRSMDVIVETHEHQHVLVTYTEPAMGRFERPEFEISRDGMRIDITVRPNRGFFNFNFGRGSVLTVFIPEDMDEPLSALNISSSSGDVTLRGVGNSLAGDINISASSGDLSLRDFSAHSLSFRTSSGDISLRDAALSGNLTARASSGDIRMDGIEVTEEISINTSSGGINLDNAESGNFRAESSSGAIVVRDLKLSGDFSAQTSSGGVTLRNSEVSGNVDIRATSGSITLADVDFDEDALSLRTTSGRITVNGERWQR